MNRRLATSMRKTSAKLLPRDVNVSVQVSGSMLQALQSRQPLLRSLQIANLPGTRPIPPPHPPPPLQPSSPPALPPNTPTPLECTEQEQNDDSELRAVRRSVDKRAT
jgi:hypothetical protein